MIKAMFGMGAGLYFLYKGIGTWRKKRAIEDVPLSKIRSVAMGPAEVCGEVRSLGPVRAPFSGTECVFCKFKVEVPQKNGWRTVDSGTVQSVFYVNDGTGEILVNPEGGEFYGDSTYEMVITSSDKALHPGPSAWLETRSQGILGMLGNLGRHRFTEWVVTEKQMVFVKGAISKARHSVQGKVAEENLMSRAPDGTLLLSAYSEERLLGQWKWQVPLAVVGGFALFLGCLSYIVCLSPLSCFLK